MIRIDNTFEKRTENSPLSMADVISRLQSLTKYEANIAGGCECCGTWVEHTADDKYGEWIKIEDIEALVNELQSNGL